MTVARMTIARHTAGYASQHERDFVDALKVYGDVCTLSPEDRAGILRTILEMGRSEAALLTILEEQVAQSKTRSDFLMRDFVYHSVGVPNFVVEKIIQST